MIKILDYRNLEATITVELNAELTRQPYHTKSTRFHHVTIVIGDNDEEGELHKIDADNDLAIEINGLEDQAKKKIDVILDGPTKNEDEALLESLGYEPLPKES